MDETNPQVLRRLETRLLVRDASGYVYGATYKWRADNSDADLVTNGFTEDITIRTVAGTRTQHWFYPGRQDCLTCHTPASGGVLGVNTRQLNGDFTYRSAFGVPALAGNSPPNRQAMPAEVGTPNRRAGVTDNQLRALGHIGLFDDKFDERKISRYPRLASLTNSSAALELRVRSYLDANCSQCHRPGAAGAFFDTRFDTPLRKQNLVAGPVANQLGVAGAKVVAPADLNRSILFHRISITGENQMPPLARNLVDTNAVAVIGEWILSLPARLPELPKGWSSADIGAVGATGEASYLNGAFNVLASGDDIWENADAFHFVSREWNGDGEIIARVAAIQYTDPWAKAGVMFRENDSAGAKNVFFACTGQGGSALQMRRLADGPSDSVAGPEAKLPRWIKLARAGSVFTASLSADGTNWLAAGSVTNVLGKKLAAGIAVTAHNNAVLNSTLFQDVR